MKTIRSRHRFNPRKIAHYEKENYIAYYQKRWPRLLRVSVGMAKEAFGLSWLQAIYAAYLIARAEIAFAPFPNNDVPLAEAYMRRFYTFLNKVHHLDLDVAQAARLDVRWWIIHRQLFAKAENQPLVDALMDWYAFVYGVEREQVRQAAYHRAQGMLYSDLWVNAGKPKGSPLLMQEEEELVKAYTALNQVIREKGERKETRERV
jgi:hypothetical protein